MKTRADMLSRGKRVSLVGLFIALFIIGISGGSFFVPMAAADEPTSGLVGWWKAESNANDSVGSNNGTLHGGATYAAGKSGQAFSFDGAGGCYLNIPYNDGLDIQGSLSVSGWVYLRNSSGIRLIAGRAGSTQLYSSDGSLHFVVYSGGTPYHVISTALTINSWHYVSGVFDGTGGVSKIYIDGALNNTSSSIPGQPDSSAAPYEIGGFSAYGANLDGLVDELKIYNRALNAGEVANLAGFNFISQTGMPLSTTIVSNPVTVSFIGGDSSISISSGEYSISTNGGSSWGDWASSAGTISPGNWVKVRQTSSSTNSDTTIATLTIGAITMDFSVTTAALGDPNASGLVSWWKAENNAYDSVGGNHGTAMNGVTYAAGKVNQAFSFDGVDDYVSVSSASSLNITNGDFTVEVWIYLNAIGSYGDGIIGRLPSDNSSGWGLAIQGREYGIPGKINFFSNNNWIGQSSGAVSANVWTHVAVTRAGNLLTYYINGSSSGSFTNTGNSDNSLSLSIGDMYSAYPSSVWKVNGLIDEVKIFNRALSATEVSKLAGKYTLTISKDGTGSGTVTSSPTGISCGSTCSYPFDDATHVDISASAAEGSVFDSWSGGVCSGNNSPCSVVMDADKSVTATFKLKADFVASPTSGQAPMAVQFTDQSADGATSWYWEFGDGGTSTLQNPVHMYKIPTGYPASYNVSLIANGSKTTKNDFITLTSACSNGPFKIGSTIYSEYPTVQAVYNAMGDATLQIQAQTFGGNLLLDQPKTIKLQGGYDCNFTSNPGVTIINDKMTIKDGKAMIEKIIIK
jgi:PKD repeat protein